MSLPSCLTLRTVKGSVLSWVELDNNFICLNNSINNVASLIHNGNMWHIPSGNTVTIDTDYQYFIYGDMVIEGTLQLSGGSQLVVLNGDLIFSGGSVVGDGDIYNISLPEFDTKISGLTYSGDTLTIYQNDGSTYSTTIVNSTDITVTGGTYNPTTGTATFYDNNGGNFDVNGFLTGYTDVQVSGLTYSGDTLTLTQTDGSNFNVTINSSTPFTGNTSGDCITDLYVTNLNSCSPLHIQPVNTGDVYISENGGNVGIGTSTPSKKLEVSGDSLINGFILGRGNGGNINNIAFGKDALFTNTGGTRNTAIGYESLYSLLSTNGNTAVGYQSLRNNIGNNNTAIGSDVLGNNTLGSGNVGIGRNSLINNLTGDNNIAIDGATGALLTNTTGNQNIGIGGYSLYVQNGVNGSVAVGWATLYSNVSGTGNSAIGYESLRVSTGNNNTALGYSAGVTHTTGDNNTFIGNNTDSTTTGITNSTAIGYNTKVSQSNTVILGNGVNVGIGTSTPTKKLQVNGDGLFSSSTSNVLTIIGSGSSMSSPLFNVQGSSGQLFSVSDSLIGSLFSVNDISGLPILEAFSDNTILMGDFNSPSLNTTKKVVVNSGVTPIYSIPSSGYTGAFYDYTVLSSLGARSGNIMSIWSGTSIQYSETSTTSIGDTSGIIFSVSLSGNSSVLSTSANTNSWTVKTIVRSI